MGLRSPTVPFSKMDQQQSDQYARKVPVVPDDGSVGEDVLKPKSVTEPKLGDGAVSTRATADKAITDAKLRDSNALSVVGRSTNTNGSPADIAASVTNTFLARRGTQLVFDPLVDADIPATIARDTEVTAAVAAHVAAVDPHTQYLTQTEGDARYRELTDAVTYAELTGKPAVLALLFSGTGTPEGAVTAGVGSLFLRTDGGAATTLYIKESGAGNTGWVGK
jgi:hypothetical protein